MRKLILKKSSTYLPKQCLYVLFVSRGNRKKWLNVIEGSILRSQHSVFFKRCFFRVLWLTWTVGPTWCSSPTTRPSHEPTALAGPVGLIQVCEENACPSLQEIETNVKASCPLKTLKLSVCVSLNVCISWWKLWVRMCSRIIVYTT